MQARAVRGALRLGAARGRGDRGRRSARSTTKKYKTTPRDGEVRRLEGAARRRRRRAGPARRVLRLRCPHCAAFKPMLEQVLARRAGQGRRVLHDVPAREAPRLARARRRRRSPRTQQGKFKEMHDDAVRRSRPRTTTTHVTGYAKELGLDMAKFEADYDAAGAQVASRPRSRARPPVWTPRRPCSSTTASTKDPCIPSTSRCGSTKSSR